MLGSHCIKHWSSTQASVALSSGEAEFAGVIRGAGQGLGYKALLQDLGVGAQLRVWTDSSAAIGICNRQGLGKLRHLDTHTLWIQQAVRTGRVDLRKVLGEDNPADLLTKHSLSRQRLEKLVALHGCKYLGGRAASAPMVREGETTRTTMASAGGGLIGAAGDGTVGAAHGHARVGGLVQAVVGGTLHGSGDPDEEPSQHFGSGSPTMPHLLLSGQQLDDAYPPMTVPEEELLPDLARDEHDSTLQRGMEEAKAISEAARDQGRKRKMSPTTTASTSKTTATTVATTTPTSKTTATTVATTTTTTPSRSKETKEALEEEALLVENLEATDVATTRSSLGRRRSEKRSLASPQDSKENTEKMKRNSHVSIECLSCVTSSELRSCDLHRSARALYCPGRSSGITQV